MSDPTNKDVLVLAQLEAMKLQLTGINTLLQSQHASTNQRIDDLRHSIEGRMNGHEGRIGTLERNERGTAIRTATVSALTSALVAGCIAVLKNWRP